MTSHSATLATRAGLARRWGISPQRVGQLATRPDFPPPVPVLGGGRQALYEIAAADAWRKAQGA